MSPSYEHRRKSGRHSSLHRQARHTENVNLMIIQSPTTFYEDEEEQSIAVVLHEEVSVSSQVSNEEAVSFESESLQSYQDYKEILPLDSVQADLTANFEFGDVVLEVLASCQSSLANKE